MPLVAPAPPHNAGTIARLCERLEGLPLALELCAAWAQTLTPAQMLAQLAGRFDLLVSRRADIAPRHRTLRATLEYSYLLLPADLQRLFVRLSVFRGGWTLEAASAFCMKESDSSGTLCNEPIHESEVHLAGLNLDFDQTGKIVGLELSGASRHMSRPYTAEFLEFPLLLEGEAARQRSEETEVTQR